MATRRIKIWAGMGTHVLAGAGVLAGAALVPAADAGPPRLDPARTELAQASPPAATPETKPHVHPGTGGEQGGERGVAAEPPPDEAFLLRLLLMKGHLRIGRELVEQGRWNDAMPHFLHPAEEIYRDLAPALAARKIAPFDKDLAALAARVKAKTGNDDTTTHNVRIHDPALMLDSGAQEPGETVRLRVARPGTYTVFCGIHPTMKMSVEVTSRTSR